jgi:hypothetical protein
VTQPESAPVAVPREVFQGLEAVRRGGLTNMLDRTRVAEIAEEMGFMAAARWVREDRERYARAVFQGVRPDDAPKPTASELDPQVDNIS